ncbi:hypothetical protein NUM3379_12220 [Kineococcus sp. NUM-3379]
MHATTSRTLLVAAATAAGVLAPAPASAAPPTSSALLAPASTVLADESPGIDDTATLVGGTVRPHGRSARVEFTLKCPRGDRWTASLFMVLVGSGAPDDITARTWTPDPSGTCYGVRQKVRLTVHSQPVRVWDYSTDPPVLVSEQVYPIPRNCSAEYGVTFTGTGWHVAFDRGGADGGPDGPGPRLCLR